MTFANGIGTDSFPTSTLFALHAPFLSTARLQEADTDCARCTKEMIRRTTEQVHRNVLEQRCFLKRDPEEVSPWSMYFGYQICAVHIRYARAATESAKLVRILRTVFEQSIFGVNLQLRGFSTLVIYYGGHWHRTLETYSFWKRRLS